MPDSNRSPVRPPQPDTAPSGEDDCHTDCWSLCEKSLGGKGTDFARYCALVVGCMSVPTFSMTPIWPALKIGTSGPSSGASAYCRPPAKATDGVSAVAVSASLA